MKHGGVTRSLAILVVALASLCAGSAQAADQPAKSTDAQPAANKPAANKPADEKKSDPKKPAAAKKTSAKAEAAAAEEKKPADAQVDMLAAQYETQMRPMLQAELNFVRQTCQLKPQDRPKVKAAGEAGMKAAARKLVEMQMGRNGIQIVFGGRPKAIDHRAQIAAALAEPLEQALGREGLARFTAQREKWLANRKRAAILSTVARVDRELLLTAEQRTRLVDVITTKWQPSWDGWLNYQSNWPHYFPQELDPLVTPCLDADQKSVWASTQKINFGWASFGVFTQNGAGEDTWWDGEPEKPAADKQK